jgi:beta-glucosidase
LKQKGDGATWNGYDEGNSIIYNFTTFFSKNLEGYTRAIEAQTGSIMASYSAINGVGNAMNGGLLMGKLKNEMEFDGFVISDYSEVGKTQNQGLPTTWIKFPNTYQATCMLVSGGIDMMMLPGYDKSSLNQYFNDLKKCVQDKTVSQQRIDDAVVRILSVKFSMGLISKNLDDIKNRNQQKLKILHTKITGSPTADVLRAAQESLVLLKNNQSFIPLAPQIKNLVLIGDSDYVKQQVVYQNFNNQGAQNGGWTVTWQGQMGNQYW